MQNTALVTGAAGFIGSHLVDKLLDRGYRVVGIDNLVLGRLSNLKSAEATGRFELIREDLLNEDSCLELLKATLQRHSVGGIDLVWHMAANSDISAGVSDPGADLRNTFLTTFHTLNLMKKLSARRILFASSSAIYGDHQSVLKEGTGPLMPISNYGAMKLASEGIISAAVEGYLEKAWIFRFPNVTGARATHGVIYDFVKRLTQDPSQLQVLGDGTQKKPYLHVSELVDAMLFIYDHAAESRNCFNIGQTNNATTVRYIAEGVVRQFAPKAKIHYGIGRKGWVGDVPEFAFSVAKLRTLGWSPKQTSDQAIAQATREIVADFRA
jgi:UDP-glucose 4-epimerase